MMIASLALAYSGFAMLCATMRRQLANNSLAILGKRAIKPAILILRLTGLALIAMALCHCMATWGVTVGISAGWLVLAVGAYLVVLTATYLPKKLAYIALACLLVAVFATVLALF